MRGAVVRWRTYFLSLSLHFFSVFSLTFVTSEEGLHTVVEMSSHSSSSPRANDFEMTDRKVTIVHEKDRGLTAEEEVVDHDPDFAGTKSTADDRLDMQRLGKKQQLIVRFILNFGAVHVTQLTASTETLPSPFNRILRGHGDRSMGDRYLPHQPRSHGRWACRLDILRYLELCRLLSHLFEHG